MRARQAFTLIEVLLVVTIVGLVTAIALPQMSAIRRQFQLDAATQQLVGDLRRARIEALKRNKKVSVVRSGPSNYELEYIGVRALDASITVTGPDTVTFASFGPTMTGPATFTLTLGDESKQILLSPAGLPSVQ